MFMMRATQADDAFGQTYYAHVINEDLSLETAIIQSWSNLSYIQCGLQCKMFSQCSGFLWGRPGAAQTNCIIGDSVVAKIGIDKIGRSMELYIESYQICPQHLGYELLSGGKSWNMPCVFLSDDKKKLDDARKICQKFKDGRLLKANSMELISLAASMARQKGAGLGEEILIGATDLEEEGTFRWEDGDVMTKAQVQEWFDPGQPNNYNRNEHCVAIKAHLNVLNDVWCPSRKRYFCELLLDASVIKL